MTAPRIAIIVGSTGSGRDGSAVGQWVLDHVKYRQGTTYDVLELDAFDLAFLAEPTAPTAPSRTDNNAQTRAWNRTIDGYDGFVWVTPGYNFGAPARFKKALDVLHPEWNHKAVGFVAYGVDGGVRTVEHWRSVVANAQLIAVRAQVALSIFHDWQDEEFAPRNQRVDELVRVLDQLEQMVVTLRPLRALGRQGVSQE